MQRIPVHLNVQHLGKRVAFYAKPFAAEPTRGT